MAMFVSAGRICWRGSLGGTRNEVMGKDRITTSCPGCRARLGVSSSAVGGRQTCPICGQAFLVPPPKTRTKLLLAACATALFLALGSIIAVLAWPRGQRAEQVPQGQYPSDSAGTSQRPAELPANAPVSAPHPRASVAPDIPPLPPAHVKSVRAILAGVHWLPQDRIIEHLKATYEPCGVSVTVGRPADGDPFVEDAALVVATSVMPLGSGDTYRVYYIWLDNTLGYMTLAGSVSSWDADLTGSLLSSPFGLPDKILAELRAPRFLVDSSAICTRQEVTLSEPVDPLGFGSPRMLTDDGNYLFYVKTDPANVQSETEETRRNELWALDLRNREPIRIGECAGARGPFLARSHVCVAGPTGLELFDVTDPREPKRPTTLLAGEQVESLSLSGSLIVCLCEGALHIISMDGPAPQVVSTYPMTIERFSVSPAGQIWLFEPVANGQGELSSRRAILAQIEPTGRLRQYGTTTLPVADASVRFAIGEKIAVAYQPAGIGAAAEPHSLELFAIDGEGMPAHSASVTGFPVSDAAVSGELFFLSHKGVLSIFSAADPNSPEHLADIPLGRILPVDLLSGIDNLSFPDIGALMSFETMELLGTRLRVTGDTIVAYNEGVRIHEERGEKTLMPLSRQLRVQLAPFRISESLMAR